MERKKFLKTLFGTLLIPFIPKQSKVKTQQEPESTSSVFDSDTLTPPNGWDTKSGLSGWTDGENEYIRDGATGDSIATGVGETGATGDSNGLSADIQYSVNAVAWHDSLEQDDVFIRFRGGI